MENDCIIWPRGKTKAGYGMYRQNGKMVYAHRVAWEEANGPIPAGMCVCHRCDTPACVNPDHLFVGTTGDNMRDKASKGRAQRLKGESNGSHKITEAQAIEIMNSPLSCRKLAPMYGVTHQHIQYIKAGKAWGYLQGKEWKR